MNTLPVDQNDLEQRIAALSTTFLEDQEKKANRKNVELLTFKDGDHWIRILPSAKYPADVAWFRKFGKHFLKPPGSKGVMLSCDWHTKGHSCSVCKAIRDNEEAAKTHPYLAEMYKEMGLKSRERYVINVVTLDKPTVVQNAEVSSTFMKALITWQQTMRQMTGRSNFFDPKTGKALLIRISDTGKNVIIPDSRDADFSHLPTDAIPDLDTVMTDILANMRGPDKFTGNLLEPVAPSQNATTAQTTIPAPAVAGLGAPSPLPVAGFGSAVPSAGPVNPFAAPAPAVTAPVVVQPFVTPAPVQPAPVVAAPQTSPFAGLSIQPAPAPVVVPAPAVASPAGPVPSASEQDELEKKLLQMVA